MIIMIDSFVEFTSRGEDSTALCALDTKGVVVGGEFTGALCHSNTEIDKVT